jgi:hypothetical protein
MSSTELGQGAGGAAERAGSSGDGAGAAKDFAGEAVDRVKQETAQFAASAQERLAGQAEQGKQDASQAIGDFAAAIRHAADELAQKDQSTAARVIAEAADGLEGLSRSLAQKGPDQLMHDLREFGRANPAGLAAGAALAGLALSRFFKSSAVRRTGASGSAPGPALTSPEEIGARADAGGPLPDRIEPGDDARLTVSPATLGHDRPAADRSAGGPVSGAANTEI